MLLCPEGPGSGFCRTAPTLFAVYVVECSMIPLHRGAAFLNTANCKHFHGVDHNHAVRFRGRVNHGKLGAAKNHAVAPLLTQMGAHLVERAHVCGAATLHVVVNNAHDLRLIFGIGQHRFQAIRLELVLQHARVPPCHRSP